MFETEVHTGIKWKFYQEKSADLNIPYSYELLLPLLWVLYLTVLESQRKCNKKFSSRYDKLRLQEKIQRFKILLHNGGNYLFKGKKMLCESEILEITSPVLWRDEKSLLHTVCMWRLLSVSPKLKHISRNFMEIKSIKIKIWFI